jgi:hypothetical protein
MGGGSPFKLDVYSINALRSDVNIRKLFTKSTHEKNRLTGLFKAPAGDGEGLHVLD